MPRAEASSSLKLAREEPEALEYGQRLFEKRLVQTTLEGTHA